MMNEMDDVVMPTKLKKTQAQAKPIAGLGKQVTSQIVSEEEEEEEVENR